MLFYLGDSDSFNPDFHAEIEMELFQNSRSYLKSKTDMIRTRKVFPYFPPSTVFWDILSYLKRTFAHCLSLFRIIIELVAESYCGGQK